VLYTLGNRPNKSNKNPQDLLNRDILSSIHIDYALRWIAFSLSSLVENKMQTPTQRFVDARRNRNPIIDADALYFQDARRREIFALDARRVHKNGSGRQTPNPINLPPLGRASIFLLLLK